MTEDIEQTDELVEEKNFCVWVEFFDAFSDTREALHIIQEIPIAYAARPVKTQNVFLQFCVHRVLSLQTEEIAKFADDLFTRFFGDFVLNGQLLELRKFHF